MRAVPVLREFVALRRKETWEKLPLRALPCCAMLRFARSVCYVPLTRLSCARGRCRVCSIRKLHRTDPTTGKFCPHPLAIERRLPTGTWT